MKSQFIFHFKFILVNKICFDIHLFTGSGLIYPFIYFKKLFIPISNQSVCLKKKTILPWISIPIVLKRISNVDLSTVDPAVVRICTDGDCNCVDLMYLQKVQSPPWTIRCQCGATGSIFPVTVMVSIDGTVSPGCLILTGLSGYASPCDINVCAGSDTFA